ncbi:hypothetical protein [Hymenobacter gummosus]|nr:hypothetical protein [Hymenobacter gummosus]
MYNIRPRIYNCQSKFGSGFFDQGELTIGRNKHPVPRRQTAVVS